jgi:helicase
MRPADTPLPPSVQKILQDQGIDQFYPPQAQALPKVFEKKNIILAIPTAAGKSLVAYIAIIHRLLAEGGKALYIVPLRALAREKYEDLKAFEPLGLKVGISTGDLDESDTRLAKYDIIVCTSEKADSLLRHGLSWVDQVRVMVIDEIHLIHDPSRGPTLEVIISRFKAINPKTQLIALSATIKNAIELADWLGAELIQSDWRPVTLHEGVYFKHVIRFDDGSKKPVAGDAKQALDLLVEYALRDGGQSLVFVNNRKSTVSVCQRLGEIIAPTLSEKDMKQLNSLISTMRKEQGEIVAPDESLSVCMQQGVAFHHAGLDHSQRRAVEQGFKDRLIKCIVATPTLAAGVNLPARTVIIRDLWRYDMNFGMVPIPILEYKQQAGRAGRPRYDSVGEAIAIAKDSSQEEAIFSNYILADTEPIYSKLGTQPALRMHLLAAIATGFVRDLEGIIKFVHSTFYAYQADQSTIEQEVRSALEFLKENQFVESVRSGFIPTAFGTQTSSLYVDPLSAVRLKSALECVHSRDVRALGFLHAVCSTPDLRSLYMRGSDAWVEEKLEHVADELLVEVPARGSAEYEWFLSDLKTAFLLNDWIEEIPLDSLVTKYNVWPGDVHTVVEVAEWLLHALREYARMYEFSSISSISDVITRVQHGCKEELLNLVSLKGIGRVRARALYNAGFMTVNSLRGIPEERLAKIRGIGKAVAVNIKKQLGESVGTGNTVLKARQR